MSVTRPIDTQKVTTPRHSPEGHPFAHWDDEPRCEVKIAPDDRQCTLAASWHWDFHGNGVSHSRGIMCTGHLELWHEEALQAMLKDGPPRCARCGQIFHSLSEACTFRRL